MTIFGPPLAGTWNRPDLLQQREHVELDPVLDGPAVRETPEVHVLHAQPLPRRGDALELTLMRAGYMTTARDGVAFQDRLLQNHLHVRKRGEKHSHDLLES